MHSVKIFKYSFDQSCNESVLIKSVVVEAIFDAKTHLRPSTFCHEPELYSVTEPNRVLSQEMNVPVNPASAAAVCVQESTRTLRDGGT